MSGGIDTFGRVLLAGGCVVCGGQVGPVCAGCAASMQRAPALDLDRPPTVALVAYEGVGRDLVAALKYRNGRPLVRSAAPLLARLVTEPIDLVTWVPSSLDGRRRRGFDQAGLLARSLARQVGRPARRLLVREPGPPQTGRRRSERLVGPLLRARRRGSSRVLVVDDVVTTGTTMRRAGEALHLAGWVPVLAVALAATPCRSDSPTGGREGSTVRAPRPPMVDVDH